MLRWKWDNGKWKFFRRLLNGKLCCDFVVLLWKQRKLKDILKKLISKFSLLMEMCQESFFNNDLKNTRREKNHKIQLNFCQYLKILISRNFTKQISQNFNKTHKKNSTTKFSTCFFPSLFLSSFQSRCYFQQRVSFPNIAEIPRETWCEQIFERNKFHHIQSEKILPTVQTRFSQSVAASYLWKINKSLQKRNKVEKNR